MGALDHGSLLADDDGKPVRDVCGAFGTWQATENDEKPAQDEMMGPHHMRFALNEKYIHRHITNASSLSQTARPSLYGTPPRLLPTLTSSNSGMGGAYFIVERLR